jgi:hypothetical protein
MASSIRLPAPGASPRITAMLADFGAFFSMALVVCLCGVLIAGLGMVSTQMQSAAQAKAMAAARELAAEQEFNARYYPLVDSKLFRMPQVGGTKYWYRILVPPHLEALPTLEVLPQTLLYPVSFPDESYGPLPATQ